MCSQFRLYEVKYKCLSGRLIYQWILLFYRQGRYHSKNFTSRYLQLRFYCNI